MGTSMDSESARTRQLNCWDGPAIVSSFLQQWANTENTPDFEPDDGYCNALIDIGFNECSNEAREFWRKTIKENYRGDEGRRRIRMAAINLAERGGLHLRLPDVRCPVLWLHVGGPKSIARLMLSGTGHQGRSVLTGKCDRGDPEVYRLPKCKAGAGGRRCSLLELLSSRRSRACPCAICQSVQVDDLSQECMILEITDAMDAFESFNCRFSHCKVTQIRIRDSSKQHCRDSAMPSSLACQLNVDHSRLTEFTEIV